MYNENVTVADLNGDGFKEIIAPTDTHYITALDRNGNQLADPRDVRPPRQPGPHALGARGRARGPLRGPASASRTAAPQHRPNFANSAPAIADLDGDGTREIVVPGDVYNCGDRRPGGRPLPPALDPEARPLALERAAGSTGRCCPRPEPGSGPLSQDFNVIENSVQNAVLADLDSDGRLEILLPSYDGRLHAWWLDKTEHGTLAVRRAGHRHPLRERAGRGRPRQRRAGRGDLHVVGREGRQHARPAPHRRARRACSCTRSTCPRRVRGLERRAGRAHAREHRRRRRPRGGGGHLAHRA